MENFGNCNKRRTFLLADFEVTTLGTTHQCQRCLTCYATDQEMDEKIRQLRIANDRLATLFKEFDQAGIKYEKRSSLDLNTASGTPEVVVRQLPL